MEALFGKLAALFLSFLALAASIKKVADMAEDAASTEARSRLARWLRSTDTSGRLLGWAQAFSQVVDSVFGKNHWTWGCFFRSVAATATAVIAGLLALWAFRPQDFSNAVFAHNAVEAILLAYGSAFVFASSYLSLWETRQVVTLMKNSRFPGQNLLLLVFDILLSFAILALGVLLMNLTLVFADAFLVQHPDFRPQLMTVSRAIANTWNVLTLRPEHPIWVIDTAVYWPTFLGTTLLVIFLLSRVFLVGAPHSGRAAEFARRWLDVDGKPFKALGTLSIVVVAALYAVALVPLAILVFIVSG